MRVTTNEVKEVIESYYKEKHPEFVLTKRIMNNLVLIVQKGLNNTPDNMKIDQAYSSIYDFLEKDNILEFIKNRQPYISPIPDKVIASIENYIANNFPNMHVCHIYRKSNHPEEHYLYMVIATKNDGTFSCWSSWNEITDSLNCGHYNLKSEQEGISILKDLFNDITDEQEKYGMNACEYTENQVIEDEEERQKHIETTQNENTTIINRDSVK